MRLKCEMYKVVEPHAIHLYFGRLVRRDILVQEKQLSASGRVLFTPCSRLHLPHAQQGAPNP